MSSHKTKLLEYIVRETFWMARRYAHGRHTFAPSTVRECYNILKKHFPHLVPVKDATIEPPTIDETTGNFVLPGDFLDDCNEDVS